MSSKTMRFNGDMPRGRDLGRAASLQGYRVAHCSRGMHTTQEEAVHTTHGKSEEPRQCP